MPSLPDVLLCALSALALSLCVGLPLARVVAEDWRLALPIAPVLGWAVSSVLALPLLTAIGFSRGTVALVCGAAAAGGLVALYGMRSRKPAAAADGARVPLWTYAAAAAVAVLPALGAWPKLGGGGLVLAESMFDHSKVAGIDDIIRLGLPPGNPFFGEAGTVSSWAYYYLWHFSAAVFGALCGASGWEADIALTGFTAFASLALMMGFAVHLSTRPLAALCVVLLSLGASLRPVLSFLSPEFAYRLLSQYQSPKGWLFQATWVPQHLASASCAVLSAYLMTRLVAPRGWLCVPVLAASVAAGFESSAWVGGIVFGAGAVAIGLALLLAAEDARSRRDLLAKSAVAVLLAAAISFPFLRDEYAATAARGLGVPIALKPFEVLGPIVSGSLRRALDLPAYWLILLAVEFPAIYWPGTAAMAAVLADRRARDDRLVVLGLALMAFASFGLVWLFASTIANNDLGWRGVLPGVLVLTVFAAAGLARWLTAGRTLAAAAALVCLVLALPDGVAISRENVVGTPTRSAPALAESAELWAAVRRHAAPKERVGNNPLFLADSVRWPVNISWALFANRRSCFAGWNLARAFVPLPEAEIDRIERLFDRVFAGEAQPQDVDALARRYACRVVVVTAGDGAWSRDPFAQSGLYRLVEGKDATWRIYRAVE